MNNLLTKATTVASVPLAVDNQLVAKQVYNSLMMATNWLHTPKKSMQQ